MEAQAPIPRAKADAEVGKEWGSQLGAAGRASFQAATPRNPFVLFTWKAIHSRWGGGSREETLHAEVPFGCCGAGRSCPFSTRFPAASPNANEAPPPQSLSSGSLRSLYSRTSEPRHRMMESSRLGLLTLPSPYAPPALETSSSAAPTRRGHQAWALQSQLAKSLLSTLAGWLPLTCGRTRRVDDSNRGLGNK